ncbi:regulator of chromosome condensation 1/beta-lactamase-inhibitor protein II [Tuber brumale]|nr:regulator of chromosome condensation 1/beta-lactamase-inhibitor protein II [Tuber brumale]
MFLSSTTKRRTTSGLRCLTPDRFSPVATSITTPSPLRVRSTLPSQRLAIYAFGTGECGELGLRPEVNAKVVKRPRLNAHLLPDKVGIVAVAIGGMHGLALSYEGKVYSWGVNDQYALGRGTTHTPLTRVVCSGDDGDSDCDDEVPLNPLESTPMLVTGFPEGTVITSIAAGDSISIAVTDTGRVYGWGTFRCADGILGFNERTSVQEVPVLLPMPQSIVRVSIGTDHVLGLTKEGEVYAWGNGQQSQLGRRVSERRRLTGLTPRQVSLPRRQVKYVATGSYHSFAITRDGCVWAWGLNQYGQCGIYEPQRTGEDSTVIPIPTVVQRLAGYAIVQISAGEHHSTALTESGELLVWGRLDGGQLGIDPAALSADDCVRDARGNPRYLRTPHAVPGIRFSTIGTSISWGFSGSYQTGLGPDADDEIMTPTKIENTATRGVRMTFAAAGGQFSILAGVPADPANCGYSCADAHVNDADTNDDEEAVEEGGD